MLLPAPGADKVRTWPITREFRNQVRAQAKQMREEFNSNMEKKGYCPPMSRPYTQDAVLNLLTLVALHSEFTEVPEQAIKVLRGNILLRQCFDPIELGRMECVEELDPALRQERLFYRLSPPDFLEYIASFTQPLPHITDVYPGLSFYGETEGYRLAQDLWRASHLANLMDHFRYKMPGNDLSRYALAIREYRLFRHIQNRAKALIRKLDLDLNKIRFLSSLTSPCNAPRTGKPNRFGITIKRTKDHNHQNPFLQLDRVIFESSRKTHEILLFELEHELDDLILPVFISMLSEFSEEKLTI